MCSAFAESAQGAVKDGQQGCSSKGRKQERAQRERRARYALKPAPPFTLMLRLGRSQGSCPKGPRKSYLPGRGDTMITKVVHPGTKGQVSGSEAYARSRWPVSRCELRKVFYFFQMARKVPWPTVRHHLSAFWPTALTLQPIGTTAGVLAL
ncbi:hypothetical protein SRHO_G00342430 [Serrasalmus rhombeus]